MGRHVRAIAIGVRWNLGSTNGSKNLATTVCATLSAIVDTPSTRPAAVRLGDHDCPDRRGKPGSRTHPIPDLVEVALKVGLELVQILAIHAGGTLVGLDLPPRLPHQLLGNRKRLAVRLWHVSSRLLPGPRPWLVDWTSLVSRPLGSTPTPASRSFSATTGRSASERRDRYSMPSVSASARSLSPTFGACDPGRLFRRSLSHVPCKSRRPGSRRLYAGHRLASNAGSRQAHAEDRIRLRFDVVSTGFDASNDDARPGHKPGPVDSGTSS